RAAAPDWSRTPGSGPARRSARPAPARRSARWGRRRARGAARWPGPGGAAPPSWWGRSSTPGRPGATPAARRPTRRPRPRSRLLTQPLRPALDQLGTVLGGPAGIDQEALGEVRRVVGVPHGDLLWHELVGLGIGHPIAHGLDPLPALGRVGRVPAEELEGRR